MLSGIPAAAALATGGILGRRWLTATAATPAKFVVTYTGNPPDAVKAAFQYALDLWAKVLSSPVDIKVTMDWSPGGPSGFVSINGVSNFPGAPKRDVFYPAALANRLAGTAQNATSPDMTFYFNSTISPTGVPDVFSWYLGTDGRPSPAQYDLITTALLLAGLGLGLYLSVRVSGPAGSIGIFGGQPTIADTLLVDGSGRALTSFPPNSTDLGAALYAGPRISGAKTNAVAGGPAKLSIYSGGLDLDAFPPCTTDSLLASFIRLPGFARVKPGPLERAVLDDLGWAGTAAAQGASGSDGEMTFATLEGHLPGESHGGCEVLPVEAPVEVQPRDPDARNAAATAITVNFSADFPEAARAVVREAARIWAGLISTPVEVIITARWDLTSPGLLGLCSPVEVRDFPNAPLRGVLYVTSLANKFAGTRVTSGHDMLIRFANRDATFWYFGVDGKPGSYHYELLGVVLHEIGHGLAHIGTPLVLAPGDAPRAWDLFFGGRYNQRLLDYPAGSQALLDELVAAAYFRGPAALAAANGATIRLHPSGHRYSTYYCDQAPPPLMATPAWPGKAGRPDAVMLGSLRDLGWETTTAKPVFRELITGMMAHD